MSAEVVTRAELEQALCCQVAAGPDLATLLPDGFDPEHHVQSPIARELAWAALSAASLGKSWDDFGGMPSLTDFDAARYRRAMNTWRAVLVGLCGEAGLNRSMVRKYIERCDEYATLALRSPASWLMELTAEEERRGDRKVVAVQTDG